MHAAESFRDDEGHPRRTELRRRISGCARGGGGDLGRVFLPPSTLSIPLNVGVSVTLDLVVRSPARLRTRGVQNSRAVATSFARGVPGSRRAKRRFVSSMELPASGAVRRVRRGTPVPDPTTRFAPIPSGCCTSARYRRVASHPARAVVLLRIEESTRRGAPDFVSAIFEDLAWLASPWGAVRARVSLSTTIALHFALVDEGDVSASSLAQTSVGKRAARPDGLLSRARAALSSSERSERLDRGDPYALGWTLGSGGASVAWMAHEHQGRAARSRNFSETSSARKETPARTIMCHGTMRYKVEVVRGRNLFESTHVTVARLWVRFLSIRTIPVAGRDGKSSQAMMGPPLRRAR